MALPGRIFRAAFMLAATITFAVGDGWAAIADEPDAEARYQSLLAAAKAGDQPVDWQALRFAYADRPSFSVFGDGQEAARKLMFADLNAGDFSGVVKEAGVVTDADFVDGEAHVLAAFAYDKLGQPVQAARERAVGMGLIHSIMTGDGGSQATAFTVITVAEEYSLMRLLGRRVTVQHLLHDGEHSYDLLDTVDQSGHSGEAYFLIDRVLAAEATALKPKP